VSCATVAGWRTGRTDATSSAPLTTQDILAGLDLPARTPVERATTEPGTAEPATAEPAASGAATSESAAEGRHRQNGT
jgi:hypothetical protein